MILKYKINKHSKPKQLTYNNQNGALNENKEYGSNTKPKYKDADTH